MTKPTLLVMAAGGGARYGRLKQIDALGPNNTTMVEYSIYDALQVGIERVVFVIRRDIEEIFRSYVGKRIESQVDTSYVYQGDAVPPSPVAVVARQKPWGTAHAVLSAIDVVDGPFVVINADDFYGNESFSVISKQLQSQDCDATLIGFSLRNALSEFGPVKRGLCEVSGDMLQSVTEVDIEADGGLISYIDADGNKHPLTGDEIVSMNMWSFKPEIFQAFRESWFRFARNSGQSQIAEFYIPSVVRELISEGGSCRVLETPSSWFGVTYPADRPIAVRRIRELVSQGVYPERLWPLWATSS